VSAEAAVPLKWPADLFSQFCLGKATTHGVLVTAAASKLSPIRHRHRQRPDCGPHLRTGRLCRNQRRERWSSDRAKACNQIDDTVADRPEGYSDGRRARQNPPADPIAVLRQTTRSDRAGPIDVHNLLRARSTGPVSGSTGSGAAFSSHQRTPLIAASGHQISIEISGPPLGAVLTGRIHGSRSRADRCGRRQHFGVPPQSLQYSAPATRTGSSRPCAVRSRRFGQDHLLLSTASGAPSTRSPGMIISAGRQQRRIAAR
jgi:hypothetical protein